MADFKEQVEVSLNRASVGGILTYACLWSKIDLASEPDEVDSIPEEIEWEEEANIKQVYEFLEEHLIYDIDKVKDSLVKTGTYFNEVRY